jgi:hypothetical protein
MVISMQISVPVSNRLGTSMSWGIAHTIQSNDVEVIQTKFKACATLTCPSAWHP